MFFPKKKFRRVVMMVRNVLNKRFFPMKLPAVSTLPVQPVRRLRGHRLVPAGGRQCHGVRVPGASGPPHPGRRLRHPAGRRGRVQGGAGPGGQVFMSCVF